MDHSQRPIAIFDSGLGGLSVLIELLKLMPDEDYIYFGDSQNAPYGVKTAGQVAELTRRNIAALIDQGAKAVVVACNTASSVSLKHLRAAYPHIPIIGMEPALKPAVEAFPGGRILVLATEMTLAEEKFSLLLANYAHQADIITLPAPGIVEIIEKDGPDDGSLSAYLDDLLAPYRLKPVDGVVLGCTHFSFAWKPIHAALGNDAQLFDGAGGTARQTHRQLAQGGLLRENGHKGRVTLMNSSEDPQMLLRMERLLYG